MIIHVEIKEEKTGNCIPLEEISILNVSSTKNPVDIINATTDQNSHKKWLNVLDTTHTDHDYCLQFPFSSTEYKNKVIIYITGYILRKLMKILHCTKCIGALIEQNADTNNNLINVKNRGSLIYPSKDLVCICKKIETAIQSYIYKNKTLNNFNVNAFVHDIMITFIDIKIFEDLKEHISDQCLYSNHVNHLLRIVIESYCKTRLTYYIQNVHISDRHKLNKLILFKGQ